MNKHYLLVAVICLTFEVTVAQTPSRVAKFNASGTGVIDSQIHDNGSAVITGGTSVVGGEYFSIQKNQNAWTALRVSNSTSGNGASANLSCTSNGHSISMTEYSSGYLSVLGSIYQPNMGVIAGNGSSGMHIGTTSNSQMSLWTNSIKRVTVNSNGNVGISTTSPTDKLSVLGGGINWGNTVLSSQLTFDQGGSIELGASNLGVNPTTNGTPYLDFHFGNGNAEDYNARIVNSADKRLDFNFGAGSVMALRWNTALSSPYKGQVIIGSLTQTTGSHTDFRLSVDGKIVSQSLYVTLSDWADYVFDPSYKLKNLSELESYIKVNGHLPNVPTTNEILKNGANVGETNRVLLEKIEELTLYIIEQNKRLEKLEKTSQN